MSVDENVWDVARRLADDLRRWTERMNEGLAKSERAMADAGHPPLSTVVVTHHSYRGMAETTRSNVLGWDGQRFTWNGRPLLSCSRDARIAACEHLQELVEWKNTEEHP